MLGFDSVATASSLAAPPTFGSFPERFDIGGRFSPSQNVSLRVSGQDVSDQAEDKTLDELGLLVFLIKEEKKKMKMHKICIICVCTYTIRLKNRKLVTCRCMYRFGFSSSILAVDELKGSYSEDALFLGELSRAERPEVDVGFTAGDDVATVAGVELDSKHCLIGTLKHKHARLIRHQPSLHEDARFCFPMTTGDVCCDT